MPGISHNTPLSTQLADELRRRIAEGEYAVGALLPTEAELAAEPFGALGLAVARLFPG